MISDKNWPCLCCPLLRSTPRAAQCRWSRHDGCAVECFGCRSLRVQGMRRWKMRKTVRRRRTCDNEGGACAMIGGMTMNTHSILLFIINCGQLCLLVVLLRRMSFEIDRWCFFISGACSFYWYWFWTFEDVDRLRKSVHSVGVGRLSYWSLHFWTHHMRSWTIANLVLVNSYIVYASVMTMNI